MNMFWGLPTGLKAEKRLAVITSRVMINGRYFFIPVIVMVRGIIVRRAISFVKKMEIIPVKIRIFGYNHFLFVIKFEMYLKKPVSSRDFRIIISAKRVRITLKSDGEYSGSRFSKIEVTIRPVKELKKKISEKIRVATSRIAIILFSSTKKAKVI